MNMIKLDTDTVVVQDSNQTLGCLRTSKSEFYGKILCYTGL